MKKFKKKTKKKQKEKKKESSSNEETKNKVKYEINEDILDSSSFSEYEFESLKDEIKIMLKEINKDISYDSENMSNEEDESKENMKSDFMDESNYFAKKDNYSEKGNLILNNNSNDTKGKLNNLNNPFIKAQKNLELTEDLKQNNIKKEKQEIENSENKYNNKPPYNFNNKEGKVLNKESILVSKEDLIDYSSDKNPHNYWYKKFSYLGKTFIQMTKNKDGKKNEYIIYYCNKHFTTIDSDKLNKEGKKLKVSKCYARVFYFKEREEYTIDWLHSDFCNKIIKEEYQNKADIEAEVNNYQEFRKNIKDWLDKFPLTKYREFKKKAISFYFKCQCNFEIKENTFKNIYYTWRKESPLYKKYAIFKFDKTVDNTPFLKDYNYTYLYNETGKKQFLHEHIIYCSDYFIKKLRAATHWYVDGTFVVPPTFKQMFIILYRDDISGKRYPGLFALINNKKKKVIIICLKK